METNRTFATATGEHDHVLVEELGKHHIRVTLNRPKALNALNLPMIRKLYPLYQEWNHYPHLTIIMKGAGEKAFCAGGDIRAIYDAVKDGKGDPKIASDFFYEEYRLNYEISKKKINQVAILNGITMGGGVGLSVHGRYRIATDSSVFAMPETGIGFFPDVGGSYFLPRLPNHLGYWLGLTGAKLKGEDLVRAGVATHFVKQSKLAELEQKILDTHPDELENMLKPYASVSAEGWNLVDEARPIADEYFRSESLKDIFVNLVEFARTEEDFNPQATALEALGEMRKSSPHSLFVTLAMLQKGKNMTMEECLKMEYRISQQMMKHRDFFEGVRAKLVDKENRPDWAADTLPQVKQEEVEQYFTQKERELELN